MSDSVIARYPRHRRRSGSRRRRKRFLLAIAVGLMVAILLAGTLWFINRSSPTPRRRQTPLFPANLPLDHDKLAASTGVSRERR